MKDSVLVGLYICSHDSDKVEEVKMWNVRIDKPVNNKYSPNPITALPPVGDVLGCRMEIMNVFNGVRKVIHESKGKFEAPNWMPDGKNFYLMKRVYLYDSNRRWHS